MILTFNENLTEFLNDEQLQNKNIKNILYADKIFISNAEVIYKILSFQDDTYELIRVINKDHSCVSYAHLGINTNLDTLVDYAYTDFYNTLSIEARQLHSNARHQALTSINIMIRLNLLFKNAVLDAIDDNTCSQVESDLLFINSQVWSNVKKYLNIQVRNKYPAFWIELKNAFTPKIDFADSLLAVSDILLKLADHPVVIADVVKLNRDIISLM